MAEVLWTVVKTFKECSFGLFFKIMGVLLLYTVPELGLAEMQVIYGVKIKVFLMPAK